MERTTRTTNKVATILAVLTPLLLLPLVTMHGCGDDLEDECEDACSKVAECGNAINLDVDYGLCVDECLNGPSGARDCALDCDRGMSCADYGLCIVGCGFTDEETAVETNCRNACTKSSMGAPTTWVWTWTSPIAPTSASPKTRTRRGAPFSATRTTIVQNSALASFLVGSDRANKRSKENTD